jgi:hypothetical protein
MIDNPFLAIASVATKLNSAILFAIFSFFVLIFIVISTVLTYHWKTYGMGSTTIVFARNIYFGFSGIIIFVAIVSIISF